MHDINTTKHCVTCYDVVVDGHDQILRESHQRIMSELTKTENTQIAQTHISALKLTNRTTDWIFDGFQVAVTESAGNPFVVGWGHPIEQDIAIDAIAQYARWYQRFVEQYASDLRKVGVKKPQRLKYAREQGIPALYSLMQRVYTLNKTQLKSVVTVLDGFRDLASVSIGMPERGVLIVTLVKDVIDQLHALGLLLPSGRVPNAKQAIVRFADTPPQFSQIAA